MKNTFTRLVLIKKKIQYIVLSSVQRKAVKHHICKRMFCVFNDLMNFLKYAELIN